MKKIKIRSVWALLASGKCRARVVVHKSDMAGMCHGKNDLQNCDLQTKFREVRKKKKKKKKKKTNDE
jgi:hypothetical protein